MKKKPFTPFRLHPRHKRKAVPPIRNRSPRTARPRRGVKQYVLVFFLILFILGCFAGYSYYRFDRKILPLVLASTDLRIKTAINNAIHTEVHHIIRAREVSASDFYIQSLDSNGKGNMLSVNTVLVNDICNAAAMAISERLSVMDPERISVPIGMALGLDTLANLGPRFSFSLRPTGNALVDYGSSFEAVGINQTHFEVWLTVVSTVRIINPVQSSTITISRDISLVDTIITGTVPETYLNIDQWIQPGFAVE